MQTLIRCALVAALVASATACRQSDGAAPTPTEDQRNEIGDLARDMINLVNKDPEAPKDLENDIVKYGETDEAVEQAQELTRRLIDALNVARLEEQTAQRLAHSLWVGVTATQYSQRQVEALQADVKSILLSTGVTDQGAEAVAQQLGAVQKEITNNPKRWYQVF